MKLKHGLHLAYCTNIHRGETWSETFEALQRYTLSVRQRVCPDRPYAIGLRLSDLASKELIDPPRLAEFKDWLARNDVYVFTINGFPYGRFHGTRVKEQVYRPDWTSVDRLEYTIRLFQILTAILPEGIEGSVSTLPGSFKEFIRSKERLDSIFENLTKCAEQIRRCELESGKRLHLGLEPEPLGLFETTDETISFITQLRGRAGSAAVERCIGVNYDACHLAVEFEHPDVSLKKFQDAKILISKFHLSSALRAAVTQKNISRLKSFADDVYLHQVIRRAPNEGLIRFRDLPEAIADFEARLPNVEEEWRIHFHVPLHCPESTDFGTTTKELGQVLDYLRQFPTVCSHLEMETYTWEVLPYKLKNRNVVDQLVAEYDWTLEQMADRDLV